MTSTPTSKALRQRIGGYTFLEVVISLTILSVFTVVLLELSLASHPRVVTDDIEGSERVREKFLDIKNRPARYSCTGSSEKVLSVEKRGDATLTVYGREKSRFLDDYRIRLERSVADSPLSVTEARYSRLKE